MGTPHALQSGPKLTSQTKHNGLEIHKRRNNISVSGVQRPVYGIRVSRYPVSATAYT